MIRRCALLACAALLAACAAPRAPLPPGSASWSGRLAVQVESTPAQAFAASFDLIGSPDAGELMLYSPLGTTLATVRWSPGRAELQQGSQLTRRASLQELSTDLGGAPLPVAALFSWLRGIPLASEGWEVDLSGQADGRVYARRSTPAPAAQLRILFEP